MAAEWFRLAQDVDRLKGRGLSPVGQKFKPLNFRRDTSSGSASRPNQKKKNQKKKSSQSRPPADK